MKIIIKPPAECTPIELTTFVKLVTKGGEVSSSGLQQRIQRAKALVFINDNVQQCVAIGAIKQPYHSYRDKVFNKAGVAEQSAIYHYELGWLYVEPTARGKGLGHRLIQAVTTFLAHASCYATTRENNHAMRYLLSQYGFQQLGEAYASQQGYPLVLYVNQP